MEMESLATWVDVSSVNSVCSGLIIIGLAFWARYVMVRLWQTSLMEDCAEAIQYADSLGLRLRRTGLRCRLAARGTIGKRDASVYWKGGAFGHGTTITMGDRVRRLPLLTDAEDLRLALEDIRNVISQDTKN